MKILIIDNSAIAKDNNGRYYTNALNGLFLDDLIECGNQLSYYQFTTEINKTISVYELEEHKVRCVPIKLKKNKLLNYLKAYLKIIPEIKKNDFVYFYYPNSFKYATFLCRLFGQKYGLYIRGMLGLDDYISHKIYKKAYIIFTVSDYFTKRVNEIVGRKIAYTIRPMIPYTDDDIISNRTYTKRSYYNLLFLGRIDKDKGIVELLNAMKQLSQKKKYKAFLKIVGNGPFLSEAKLLCKELDIEDIISFEGVVCDDNIKRNYYLEADVYILPTYHEGFPRTLYEAMIFGTPIITTFVGGISVIMEDNINSLKIEAKSIDSVVEKLEQALGNYLEMGRLAIKATETVRKIVDKNRLTHGQHLNEIIK